MLILFDNIAAIGIDKSERKAAELRTSATVGTAPKTVLRCIATAAVAHTQCAVNKDLELGVWHGLVYFGYLLQAELTRKNHAREARLRKETNLFHRAVIHLRTAMQLYGRNVHFGNCKVLHYKGINPTL